MTRRLNYWLLAFIAIVSVPYYWYMIADPASDNVAPKAVTVTELRKLADALPGPRPVKVRGELLGHARVMRNRLVAGWGLRPVPVAVRAYQLAIPGEAPILIGAGVSPVTAEDYGMADYSPAAQNRVDGLRSHASHTIALTGGPLQRGNLPNAPRHTAPAGAEPYPLAPGVVIIPATGIGPDAKLVYVRLASGREFLFAGAAAKVPESLLVLHPPARIAQNSGAPRFGTETKSWLMTINALRHEAPDMTVLTAHDPAPSPYVARRFSDHS